MKRELYFKWNGPPPQRRSYSARSRLARRPDHSQDRLPSPKRSREEHQHHLRREDDCRSPSQHRRHCPDLDKVHPHNDKPDLSENRNIPGDHQSKGIGDSPRIRTIETLQIVLFTSDHQHTKSKCPFGKHPEITRKMVITNTKAKHTVQFSFPLLHRNFHFVQIIASLFFCFICCIFTAFKKFIFKNPHAMVCFHYVSKLSCNLVY